MAGNTRKKLLAGHGTEEDVHGARAADATERLDRRDRDVVVRMIDQCGQQRDGGTAPAPPENLGAVGHDRRVRVGRELGDLVEDVVGARYERVDGRGDARFAVPPGAQEIAQGFAAALPMRPSAATTSRRTVQLASESISRSREVPALPPPASSATAETLCCSAAVSASAGFDEVMTVLPPAARRNAHDRARRGCLRATQRAWTASGWPCGAARSRSPRWRPRRPPMPSPGCAA